MDFVINQNFNKKFSQIKCNDFIRNILIKKIRMKYIYVSNNFRFGNKREGDVSQLIKYEHQCNYKIIKPKPLLIKIKVVS